MRRQFDVEAVKHGLATLRGADKARGEFGAASRHYRLRPCVTEERLQTFEREYGVQFPSAYRTFLTTIGNGGAGPGDGILPLGVFDPDARYQGGVIGDLSKPFPHRDYWNADEEYYQRGEAIDEVDEEAYRQWRSEYFSTALINGALPICHEGCGFFFLLIVTGRGRGQLWLDGRVSDDGIRPITDPEGRCLTFPEWYHQWLDASLTAVSKRRRSNRHT
jgi:hypothetical protein